MNIQDIGGRFARKLFYLILVLIPGYALTTEELEQNPCGLDVVDQDEFDVWQGGIKTPTKVIASYYSYEYVYEGGMGIGRQMHCTWSQICLQIAEPAKRVLLWGNGGSVDECKPCDNKRFRFLVSGDKPKYSMTVTGVRQDGRKFRIKAWKSKYIDSDWEVGAICTGVDTANGIVGGPQEVILKRCDETIKLTGVIPAACSPVNSLTPLNPFRAMDGWYCAKSDSESHRIFIAQYPMEVLVEGKPTGDVMVMEFRLCGKPAKHASVMAVLVSPDESSRMTFLGKAGYSFKVADMSRKRFRLVRSKTGLRDFIITGEKTGNGVGANSWKIVGNGGLDVVVWKDHQGRDEKRQIELRPLSRDFVIPYPEICLYIRNYQGIRFADFR